MKPLQYLSTGLIRDDYTHFKLKHLAGKRLSLIEIHFNPNRLHKHKILLLFWKDTTHPPSNVNSTPVVQKSKNGIGDMDLVLVHYLVQNLLFIHIRYMYFRQITQMKMYLKRFNINFYIDVHIWVDRWAFSQLDFDIMQTRC